MATPSQNMANSAGHLSLRKSKYKGVLWHKNLNLKAGGRWCTIIKINGKQIARHSPTETEAAVAYNEMAVQYFGNFAKLNAVPASSPKSW